MNRGHTVTVDLLGIRQEHRLEGTCSRLDHRTAACQWVGDRFQLPSLLATEEGTSLLATMEDTNQLATVEHTS